MDDELIMCPSCNEYPHCGDEMLCTNCGAAVGKPSSRKVRISRVRQMNIQAAYDAAPRIKQKIVEDVLGLSVRKGDREGAGEPYDVKKGAKS